MFWLSTKRIIRAGFINFSRNGIISLASVLVTTVTLFVITALIFLQAILSFSLAEVKDKVDVTVYFTTSATETQIMTVKSSVEKLPEVTSVTYTTAEEALETFKEKHENDYLTLQALDELGDNPLGAALNVKAADPAQYESIVSFLESDGLPSEGKSAIENINYTQNKLVIERLTAIINGAKSLGFGATLVLAIISILITFNTIRLTIFIAREEIGVMRLVGAENKYIRGPFMMEGVIYGVIASVITMIIFYPLTLWLGNNMTSFLGMNAYDYYLSNFLELLVVVLLAGVLIGSVSSFFAVNKYLKK